MKWTKRNKKTAYLLLILIALLVVSLVSFQNMNRNPAVGGMAQKAVTTIQKPFAMLGDGISNSLRGIFQFRSVVEENEKLKEEIGELKRENIQNSLTQHELEELKSLSMAFGYSGLSVDPQLLAADVIAMDGSNWFNLFTINRGTESGIKKESIVINGDGLVGRVLDTGDGWSKVIGIIDESNKVSFKVLRDPTLLGIVRGDGLAGLSGYMLDSKASVIEGDLLVTTSIGIYPEGIPIGKVDKIEFDNDTQLKNVTIIPMVNFKNIQKVAVIL